MQASAISRRSSCFYVRGIVNFVPSVHVGVAGRLLFECGYNTAQKGS